MTKKQYEAVAYIIASIGDGATRERMSEHFAMYFDAMFTNFKYALFKAKCSRNYYKE